MNRKSSLVEGKSGYWNKLVLVSLVLFFAYLGDGILSDWVPTYMQESLGSAWLMGLIMSFSSMVGLIADLVLPQLLKKVSVRKMIVLALLSSLTFCALLLWTVWWPIVALFLVSMAVWGIYYEFLGFGGQQFVAETVPSHFRSGAWAVMGSFRGLAYFLGPLLGGYVLTSTGNKEVVLVSAVMIFVSWLLWLISGREARRDGVVEADEVVNIFVEIKHWGVLLRSVWPVVIISLVLGILDATFWTTGTVLSDNLSQLSHWGGWFLPLYELPMVFMGLLVAKMGIYKGKKKLVEWSLLVTGILLLILWMTEMVEVILIIAFLVGMVTSFSWPMRDAIYSDVVSRMGFEGKHMIGLSGSTVSIAYIFGPILAGIISSNFGEQHTFGVVGLGMVTLSLILLVVTPRKMRLPESEIQKWN